MSSMSHRSSGSLQVAVADAERHARRLARKDALAALRLAWREAGELRAARGTMGSRTLLGYGPNSDPAPKSSLLEWAALNERRANLASSPMRAIASMAQELTDIGPVGSKTLAAFALTIAKSFLDGHTSSVVPSPLAPPSTHDDADVPRSPCDPMLPLELRIRNNCFPPNLADPCASPFVTAEQKFALGCNNPLGEPRPYGANSTEVRACSEPFDPPSEPSLWDPRKRECRSLEETYERNVDRCTIPDLGCDCTLLNAPLAPSPCGTACPPGIISTQPNENLIVEWQNPYWDALTPAEVQASIAAFEVWEQIIDAAWNFLQDNVDVVEWLACLLGGPDAATCLVRRLTDPDNPQRFVFESQVGSLHEGQDMWTTNPGGTIHINLDTSDDWAEDALAYEAAIANDNYTALLCVVTRVSALILHEMFHGCWGSVPLEVFDSPGDCDYTYALQSSFKWAMAHRYPCLTSAGGCMNFAESYMWMCDDPNGDWCFNIS